MDLTQKTAELIKVHPVEKQSRQVCYSNYMATRHLSLSLFSIIAFVVGLTAASAFFSPRISSELNAASPILAVAMSGTHITPGKFAPLHFSPPARGKLVGVDLDQSTVHLFEDEALVASFPLVGAAPEGSLWELAPGNYKVKTKRALHTSPITRVQVPWAVHFFGNSFFHGEPLAPSSTASGPLLTRLASYASLKLAEDDAEKLYRFAEIGTPVSVLSTSKYGEHLRLASASTEDPSAIFVEKGVSKPNLTASAYLLKDMETGTIIFEERAHEPLPIASVSKLVTAMVSEKLLTRDRMATVSAGAAATEGSAGNLSAGERVAIGDLLYALLLPSSNKAAEVIAETAGRERFMKAMNETVRSLGMSTTSFKDPSGLSPKNISTANDIVLLAEHLLANAPEILEITTTPSYGSLSSKHVWTNPNRLMVNRNPRYIGGKTGYIPEAGQTSIAIFSFPVSEFVEKRFALVLLRSYNRDADTRAVLRYLEDGLVYDTGIPPTDDDLFSRFTHSTSTAPSVANVIAVGNILASDTLEMELLQRGSSYSKVFAASTYLKGASIAFGNLVGAVTTAGTRATEGSTLRTPRRALTALSASGINALHIANEHLGDWGRTGLGQTLGELKLAGIDVLGAGDNGRAARGVVVREVNGLRLGMLGVSTVGPGWLFAEKSLPVSLRADDPSLLPLVRAASAELDHLIITVGLDSALPGERAEVRKLAHSLIDAGARVVIGMGPSVPGNFERYREGVIAYSLGDFFREPASKVDSGAGPMSGPAEGLALELVFDKKSVLAINAERVISNDVLQPVLANTEN